MTNHCGFAQLDYPVGYHLTGKPVSFIIDLNEFTSFQVFQLRKSSWFSICADDMSGKEPGGGSTFQNDILLGP
jgi:hypothetical protein